MVTKFLSMMLVATQLISWAVPPIYLCISKSGTVCVEIGLENCPCCADADLENHDSEAAACCGHCDGDKPEQHPAVALTPPCDCTHIPLTIEQADSVRPSITSYSNSSDTSVSWLDVPQEFVPKTILALILHWDRRDNPSRHPVALATTVLRC